MVASVVRRLNPALKIVTLSVAAVGCSLGCRAQSGGGQASTQAAAAQAAAGQAAAQGVVVGTLSPAESRRVEVMIRERANVPAEYDFRVSPRMKSDVPGYDELTVSFSTDGKESKPLKFLLSKDGQTLAQFTKFDISKDPKELVSGSGRPARGGSESAPVQIVVFDDLECPFCAKMNAQLFPALLNRYTQNQVRIVYKDFPLDQHPWAMRAAIDVNCVGAQSGTGYWNLVDAIHERAGEIGGTEKTVAKANEMLDTMARDEGTKQKVKLDVLNACLAKQDGAPVQASMKVAEGLGVDATPALFINGERLEGAEPVEYVYRMIDGALVAAGQTPPPAPPVEANPAAKPDAKAAAAAGKPGN
jgi:protein-disulfide isomerase